MGFDEHGQSSMRSNRSLLRSTLHKYFRGERRFALNEKSDLGMRQIKDANAKKQFALMKGYRVFLIAVFLVIILIWLLY